MLYCFVFVAVSPEWTFLIIAGEQLCGIIFVHISITVIIIKFIIIHIKCACFA